MAGREDKTQSGEDRLIAQYFRPLARHPGALGLLDDAAMLTPPAGCDLVLTKDALVVAGVHFFADDPPDSIARKALRVNLSDLAAKGATPAGFLLALALPDGVTRGLAWRPLPTGLRADAESYALLAARRRHREDAGSADGLDHRLGTLPNGSMVRRSGAKAGDRVVVTGSIGDAALGPKPSPRRRDGPALEA